MKLGRYIKGVPRVINRYDYQKDWKILDIWSDTDHAGCPWTRKSTTGGIMMFGSHAIKHWSTTQSVIALSSGEAEYYGCVRAGSIAIGIQSLLLDLGVKKDRLKIKTDASVAQSLASRRGLGGTKHIEVNQLWLQEKVNDGKIEIEKVRTDDNLADALTKYKEQASIEKHMKGTKQTSEKGRHEIMPKLSSSSVHLEVNTLSNKTEEGKICEIEYKSRSYRNGSP